MRTLPLERRVTVGRRQLEGQNKLWPVVMMFVSRFLLIVWLSDLIHTGIGVLGNHGTSCSGPSPTQQHSFEKFRVHTRIAPNLTLQGRCLTRARIPTRTYCSAFAVRRELSHDFL